MNALLAVSIGILGAVFGMAAVRDEPVFGIPVIIVMLILTVIIFLKS